MQNSTTLNLDATKDIALKDTQEDEYYEDIQQEGMLKTLQHLRENPYPGLRPFKTSEANVFFGRKDSTFDLLTRLADHRFLAVLGASGTGKSSLVRAGLLPGLKTLPGKHSLWKVAICRPGKNPFGNLAKAISKADIAQGFTDLDIWKLISSSSFGFEELYNLISAPKEHNTLIVIDQFEELFRYRKDNGISGKNESALFVKMLIAISKIESLNTYVMITMRSEYLGDCVQFPEMVDEMNNGQFLIPRLKSNQLKDAIIEPAGFSNASVEASFADKLISEIGDSMDQLPVLQHCLRRSYEEAKLNKAKREGIIITYEDYAETGGMENAIDKHSNHIYSAFTEEEKKYCTILFKCITDKATDGRGIRRPLSYDTIFTICKENDDISTFGATEIGDQLTKVIERFQQNDVNFLMPGLSEIDISHESIMRVWKLLIGWIESEAKDADLLKQLISRHKQDYLTGEALTTYTEWLRTKETSLTWASLYKSANMPDEEFAEKFRSGVSLVKLSIAKHKNDAETQKAAYEEKVKTDQELKSRKKNIRLLIVAVALSLLLVAWAVSERADANKNLKIANDERGKAQKNLEIANIERGKAQDNLKLAQENFNLALIEKARAQENFEKAKQLQLLAEQNSERLRLQSILLTKQKEQLAAINVREAEAAKIAKESAALYKKLLFRSELKDSAFYAKLDTNLRQPAIEILVPLQEDSVALNKVINSFNKAIDAQNTAPEDPNLAFAKIYEAIKIDDNFITSTISTNILSGYLFYQQNNNIPRFPGRPFGTEYKLAINRNTKTIILGQQRNFVKADLKNGKIVFDKNYYSEDDEKLEKLELPVTPDAFVYEKGHNAIMYVSGKKLYRALYDSGTRKDTLLIEFSKDYSEAKFSPNGNFLATYSAYAYNTGDSLSIMSLKNDEIKLIPILTPQKNRSVSFVKFAPDEKSLVAIYTNGTYAQISIPDGKVTPQNPKRNNKNISSLSISDENKVVFFNTDRSLGIMDKEGDIKYPLFLENVSNNSSTLVSVSPDGKYALLTSDTETKLVDLNSGKIKTLISGNRNSMAGAGFLNDQLIISVDNSKNSISTWMVNPGFSSLDQALNSDNTPFVDVEDQLKYGLINIEKIARSDKVDLVRSATEYYLDESSDSDSPQSKRQKSLSNAITLSKRLGEISNTKDLFYIASSIQIDFLLNLFDKLYGNPDYKIIVERNRRSISLIKDLDIAGKAAIDSSGYCLLYTEYSWNLLMDKQFKEALTSVQLAYNYDTANGVTKKNLALAYLLNNNYTEAEKIYSKYLNEEIPTLDMSDNEITYNYYGELANKDDLTYREIFIKDLQILESRKVISFQDALVAKILKLLKK